MQSHYQNQPSENNYSNPNVEEDHENTSSDYESEDVLSLCDLPIYGSSDLADEELYSSSALNRKSSKLSPPFSSSDDDEDNIFEFFSEEWNVTNNAITTSGTKFVPSPNVESNIIFCGKIIPSKHDKITNNAVVASVRRDSNGKKKRDVVNPKVSIYTTPLKSKLLLVLFGLPPKIPTDQTELLSDIRYRQSRHVRSRSFPAESGEKMVEVRRRSSENGLWRFIKAASCFGGQNSVNGVV